MSNPAEYSMYSELILKREERMAIGCVAVESSRVEDMIEHATWLFMGVDDVRGKAITGGLMFNHKFGLLQRLIEARGGEIAKEFESLNKRIGDANAARRIIIHGSWGLPKREEIINYLRAMIMQEERGPEMEPESAYKQSQPLKASEVIKTAREFSRLYQDLAAFLVKHFP